MPKILEDKERIQWFAAKYANAHDVFFMGRGIDYEVCLEGSLKLKEISYDYAFIFEPIETCDFSRIYKAGCRSFSLDDRYECVDLTYNIYKETGSKVCKIPVFSNDYIENFYCRYNMISEFIKKNSI